MLRADLDDLQLHALISLHTNETATDGINDPVDELLVGVVWVHLQTTKLTVGNQFLSTERKCV